MTFNFSTLNAERTPPPAPSRRVELCCDQQSPAPSLIFPPLSSLLPRCLPSLPLLLSCPVTVGKYANWVLMQIYSLRQWQQFGRSNNNNNNINCQNKKPTQYFGHQCGLQQRGGGGRGRIIPILNENWHWNYFNFHSFDCDFLQLLLQLQLQLLLLLLLQLSARRVIKAWII